MNSHYCKLPLLKLIVLHNCILRICVPYFKDPECHTSLLKNELSGFQTDIYIVTLPWILFKLQALIRLAETNLKPVAKQHQFENPFSSIC